MIFISHFRKHKIVLMPQRIQVDAFGNRMIVPGIKCVFEEYRYETMDPKIIKGLKSHKDFGIDFRSQDDVTPNETGIQERKAEEVSVNQLLTSCPQCAFKAKNEAGLRLHMMGKHKQMGDDIAE